MNRGEMLARIEDRRAPWDMVVVGGGATGAGIAVDAASRGYDVLLLERGDFGKGTSTRSTKLIHGGVRYLEQGNIPLVMEALRERGILRQNAPHLVNDLAFIAPNYDWWEAPFYGIGLKLYDLLAGKYSFGSSRILSRQETIERLPTIRTGGLRGGVIYYDGQFDDARLLIHLLTTATEQGATIANYVEVMDLPTSNGLVTGVVARDVESEREIRASGRVVINATGPFCDAVRRLANPTSTPLIAPSQGIHLVFDASFLSGSSAIMVPHTTDGRVLFAIPWNGYTVVGTTDTPIDRATPEPMPFDEEIDFVLQNARRYLDRAPERSDIRSVFTGIRPLVKAGSGSNTAALSRDHTIEIDPSGLLTITGESGQRTGTWQRAALTRQQCWLDWWSGLALRRRCAFMASRPRVTSKRLPNRNHFIPRCLTRWLMSDGRLVTKWRERWKTFWRDEREHCFFTPARRSRWPREWRRFLPLNWVGTTIASSANWRNFRVSRKVMW